MTKMLLNRDRADELMDREGVAAIVASTAINTYYLSSWATDAAWGFGDSRSPCFLATMLSNPLS
jgi:hypothetical protein